jgi:hypothetical protein
MLHPDHPALAPGSDRSGRNLSFYDLQFGPKSDQPLDGTKWANKRAEIWA